MPATRLAAVWPAARGKAPTRATPVPLVTGLAADLLPPLSPDVRAALVEALADAALAELDAVNTDPDRKE
jgi:hypothetical protein